MIRWESAPGPYEVVFSTREGGVSERPFASLNLGRATAEIMARSCGSSMLSSMTVIGMVMSCWNAGMTAKP